MDPDGRFTEAVTRPISRHLDVYRVSGLLRASDYPNAVGPKSMRRKKRVLENLGVIDERGPIF